MREFDLGFIIGLVEGEGCITLVKTGMTGDGKPRHTPELQIKNNNLTLLERARFIIGKGHIYHRKWKNPRLQDSYEYHLRGEPLLPVLIELEPHLIGKSEQARNVRQWMESKRKPKKCIRWLLCYLNYCCINILNGK